MINLLPISAKKSVKREKARRTTIVVCFSVSTLVVIQLIFFCFNLFSLRQYMQGLEDQIGIIEQSANKGNLSQLEARVGSLNNYLSLLLENENRKLLVSDKLEKIVEISSGRLFLSSFSFESSPLDAGNFRIGISGHADKRDVLISFIDELGSLSDWGKVQSPISNLLKEKDINFSLFIESDG